MTIYLVCLCKTVHILKVWSKYSGMMFDFANCTHPQSWDMYSEMSLILPGPMHLAFPK